MTLSEKILGVLQDKKVPIITGAMPNIIYLEDVDINGAPKPRLIGKFDDRCILLRVDQNGPQIIQNVMATTASGLPSVLDKKGKGGTARIQSGYHHEKWEFGYHKWDPNHPALRQVVSMKYHRDINGDGSRIGDPEDIGLYYTHQHGTRPGFNSSNIGGWSEGCLVRMYWPSHKEFIKILTTNSAFKKGYRFSATIIEQSWIQ